MNIQEHAEELAEKLINNHRSFDSFAWYDAPEDSENWCLIYTKNRDSGLVDESNAHVIDTALEPFMNEEEPDVVSEHHSHWACGWIDGYAIRVRKNGLITPAFMKYAELHLAMKNYPLLDDSDYSEREYEAALDGIRDNAPDLIREPEGWESDVFSYLSDNNPDEVENSDDRGAYPSRFVICEALDELKIGYSCPGCGVVVQAGSPTEGHIHYCEWKQGI